MVIQQAVHHLAQAGGNDEYGDPLDYAEPEKPSVITGRAQQSSPIGKEIVVKNTVWTEFALAAEGDYLLIGVSPNQTRLWPVPTRCGRLSATPTRSSAWRMTTRS
jgi:hypothetical protein